MGIQEISEAQSGICRLRSGCGYMCKGESRSLCTGLRVAKLGLFQAADIAQCVSLLHGYLQNGLSALPYRYYVVRDPDKKRR